MKTTRLLLPFTSGVDMAALEHAVKLAKSCQAILVPYAFIHLAEEQRAKGVRLEHVQQAKDFLGAVKRKAAQHGVPVEGFELVTPDVVQSISDAANAKECEVILLFMSGKKSLLLHAHEMNCLKQQCSRKLNVIHLPEKSDQPSRVAVAKWPFRRPQQQANEHKDTPQPLTK